MKESISRRRFLGTAAVAGTAATLSAGLGAAPGETQERNSGTTTLDIREYLLSKSPWVDRDNTVDTVKIGDPTQPVKKAGVCWMPSIWDIRAAHKAGCDLLICHEPTFWEHAAPEQSWRDKEPGTTKRKFLEETGMVILRCHDAWDNWPEIGIRDSWAKALGFEKRVREGTSLRWHAMYEVPEQTLREFALYVAKRIERFGEDNVQVMGDPDMKVSRPAIGVGCATPDKEMADFGADVMIMCFDGASYWQKRERLAEMGVGIVTVEHGTSEMPGLESLRDHLAEVYPAIKFQYFAEHPRTWRAG